MEIERRREIVKVVYTYSHLGGHEILKCNHPEKLDEIFDVISKVTANKSKMSKEKTNPGEMLYSPIDMNKQFKKHFDEKGYTEIRDNFNIVLPDQTEVITKAYKQVDFQKDNILIEVQFGKYAFMFYDVAKFQYFFNENRAKVGVEIVPCHRLHGQMSTGVSYGEQLIHDIERLKKHFPAVPVMVILIDIDD
jgi:hypothetical protein